jgi:hypothetical protein
MEDNAERQLGLEIGLGQYEALLDDMRLLDDWAWTSGLR